MEKYSSLTLTLIKFEKGEEICLCKTSDVKKFGNDTISKGFVIKENGEVGQIKSIYKEEMNKFLATQKFSTPVETVRTLKVEDVWSSQKIKISEVKYEYNTDLIYDGPNVSYVPYPKEITTKEQLVELIKKNFRDKDGDIDLIGLDFSGENLYIGHMKAKSLFQNCQKVEKSLLQNGQVVGIDLYQHNQDVKGKIFQDEKEIKEITTKEELVKLIKTNFRDEDGIIDLSNLDFSGEEVNIGKMKVKELYQNYQEVEGSLHQSKQKVGRILYQYNQEVGLDLHQYSQKVKGKKCD